MKLLVVDGDRHLIEMLTGWLKTLGYEVHHAYTGEQAKIKWREQRPDLVILDTTLKDVDAMQMCQKLQSEHDALVLAVNAREDVQDEVRCLESGADDYLRKPFFPQQLLARIHAVSRRGCSTLARRPPSVLTVGPIQVDYLHNIASFQGRTAHLTPNENKLLHLLAINANDVCTSEQIVTYVWGFYDDGDASLIKAHIHHLRQKLEPDPGNPRYIRTVSGVGYTLVCHPAEEGDSEELLPTLHVEVGSLPQRHKGHDLPDHTHAVEPRSMGVFINGNPLDPWVRFAL